jgi:hypothetical protein
VPTARATKRSHRKAIGIREGAAGSIPQARKPIPTGKPIALAERGGSFMKSLSRGLTAAFLLASLASSAPAYAAPTVTIRIEGEQRTLLERTTVTLDPAQVEGVSDQCPGDTVAGALDKATHGEWDHQPYAHTILDETHDFSRDDAWAAWIENTAKLSDGICAQELQEGDDVTINANFAPESNGYAWVYQPLTLHDVPQQVEVGQPFVVRATEIVPGRDQYGFEAPRTGTREPAGGVTVAGGEVSGQTGDDGRVELRFDRAGDFTLQASSGAGLDRSIPVPIKVVEPGTPPPPPPPPAEETPVPPCFTSGADGRCDTRDLEAPVALITSIEEGERFARRSGPRELKGSAGVLGADGVQADGTGILMVKLRLTRRVGGRCSTWSPSRERFVPRDCGAENGFWFKVAERADWDYLLPGRLGRGRYVLDADAIDRAGNRLRTRRRGENRVVFRVA